LNLLTNQLQGIPLKTFARTVQMQPREFSVAGDNTQRFRSSKFRHQPKCVPTDKPLFESLLFLTSLQRDFSLSIVTSFPEQSGYILVDLFSIAGFVT